MINLKKKKEFSMKKIFLIIIFCLTFNLVFFEKNNEANAFVNDFRDEKKITKTYYKWSSAKCAGPYVITGKKPKKVNMSRSTSFAETISANIKKIFTVGSTYTVGKDYSTYVTVNKYSKGCGATKVKYKYQKYKISTVDIITKKVISVRYGTVSKPVKNSETFITKYIYKNNKKRALKDLK